MDPNSFYITLLSNVESSPANTLANFYTILAKQITLEGDWRVGLTEISYTNSIYNVTDDQPIFLFNDKMKKFNGPKNKPMMLKKGCYETEDNLCSELNRILQKFPVEQKPRIKYNKFTHKVLIRDGLNKEAETLYCHFPVSLRNMLGLALRTPLLTPISFRGDTQTEIQVLKPVRSEQGILEVDLKEGVRSLLVYSDIIDPVYVGNTRAQILRVVERPSESKFGEQVVVKYNVPYYLPLVTNDFSTIRVNIKDDSGRDVPFEFGRVILTLHFVKWSNITLTKRATE